jgi:ABC-2 type transport system permease protein
MALAGNGSVYIRQAIAEEVAVRAGAVTQPFEVVTRARFNPNLLAGRFSALIELVSQITVLSVVLAGSALLREREHGTLEHLLAMPVTPAEILLAKLWANGLVIVAAATLSLLLIVRGALGVPLHGSLVLFLAGIALYQLSVAALGLLLATATSSTAQFGLLAMPVLVVMNLLSGGSTPIESMPGWLQYAVQISPATQFVAFSQTVLMRGAGLDVVAPRLFALVLLGVLFLAIALIGLRRSLARSG